MFCAQTCLWGLRYVILMLLYWENKIPARRVFKMRVVVVVQMGRYEFVFCLSFQLVRFLPAVR